MKLNDLQTGMRVVFKKPYGLWIVFRDFDTSSFRHAPSRFVAVRQDERGWVNLESGGEFDENMRTFDRECSDYDIVEVMAPTYYFSVFDNVPSTWVDEAWETIWRREDVVDNDELIQRLEEMLAQKDRIINSLQREIAEISKVLTEGY